MSDTLSPPLATVTTVGLILPYGAAAPSPVVITVEMHRRLPALVVAGPRQTDGREQAERVRNAITACRFEMPRTRIVVAYSHGPDATRADVSGCDLPIALAILEASGQIPPVKGGAPFCGLLLPGGGVALPGWPGLSDARFALDLVSAAR